MVSRVGSLVCISLGVATVVVPMVSGHVGRHLGTRIALKQPELDKTLEKTITVEPYKVNGITAKVGLTHENCSWKQGYSHNTHKASGSNGGTAL